MKSYELSYLISPELSLEALKAFQEKTTAFLQEQNGVLGNSYESKKTRLGYPIKDKKEAYLVTFYFQMNPEKLAEFEKKLKLEEPILRYIILSKKVRKQKLEIPQRKKPSPRTIAPPLKKEKPKIKKVKIQELEKKLEEILGE